ncbi:WYL domain-containing protein [Brevibacillus nitrificans]|uniref:WYL domain-containing protein n=1 Tax=Brevibacillus nitrificans TaxID=651560 RepID=UPI00260F87CE|nr:WYL domain-containing protein [Brevibacillus nitrificans]
MLKELQRAIEDQQNIQVIYLDQGGQTTMRTLRPLEVKGECLKAYCYTRKAPRVFVIVNILAIQPVVIRHVV